MDNTILYAMMLTFGLLLFVLPFGIYLGLATMISASASDPRLLLVYVLAAIIFSYVGSLGAFALIQKQNCGSVKNIKQIASNAGIAAGIQAVTLFLVWLVPFFRDLVSNLLPPDQDPLWHVSIGYGYYSMWAILYGIAIGGTLSGVCA
jgi:hypothetical protein